MQKCIITTPEYSTSVSALVTTDTFTWLTPFMPCIAMDQAIGTLKLLNMVGAMRITPAVQYAVTRTDTPSAPTTKGSTYSSDNEYFISVSDWDVGTDAPGNAYVRFGIAQHVNSVPNTGRADASLQVCIRQHGTPLEPWTGHLVTTSSTVEIFVPTSDWMPALAAYAYEAVVIARGFTGLFTMQLTYRTAATSPENPDAWNPMMTALGSLINSPGETNSGELNPTLTNKMWVQFGIVYVLSGGSTPGQADVTILPAVRSTP